MEPLNLKTFHRGRKKSNLSVGAFSYSVSHWPKSSPWDNKSLGSAGCLFDLWEASGGSQSTQGSSKVRSGVGAAVAPMAGGVIKVVLTPGPEAQRGV